ncbi:MAG: hypothetical protein Q9M89_06190 [Persephonella sp.]|nr:hypothetical protein [Persephonella sp.]
MSRAVNTPVLMIYGATHPFFGFYPFPDEGSLHPQKYQLSAM